MIKYILKRVLLMIPTFFLSTFLVFVILAYVPGGPFQRAVMRLKAQQFSGGGGETGGSGGGGITKSGELTPETLEKLRKQFGLDKPLMTRYLIWLGLYPRETQDKFLTVGGEPVRENIKYIKVDNKKYILQRWVKAVDEGGQIRTYESGVGTDFGFEGSNYTELPNASEIKDWYPSTKWKIDEKGKQGDKIRFYKTGFSGILTGDLGESYVYHEPVTTLIKERLHISAYFGIISFILTYLICIPLGIAKAIRNGSAFDISTSALIFIGYSIPAFALGTLLLVLLGGGSFWSVFPLGGFRSPDFETLSWFGKVKDQLWHTVLPVICYMVGAFATLTILMKNSLLENLSQDYVRTAFAKGLPEKTVIFKHAVRNSLIPIVARIGGIIGIFLAGSYLIERVFNIHGIGLLSLDAITQVDYPVFLGFLVINIVILLLGNLISDLCYVLVDPRIKLD